MYSKKAFSFVEIIVVVSILALLAVIWLSLQWSSNQKTQNAKAVWDIQTLNNSFESYLVEEKTLPNPKGNINYFGSGSEYVHVDVWNEDNTLSSFWKHWFVTENILPKKYLNYLPLDPRTSQYYAYWKTTDSQYFEIAWVLKVEWNNTSSVSGNYPWENWPYNLIKEYNWPDFVSNNSKTSFPYNPDEKILVAKINNYTWNVRIKWNGYDIDQNTPNQLLNHTLVEWDTITVGSTWQATLYYSDWSQSTIWDSSGNTILTLSKMEFKEDNNLVTKIQLALASGTIWTKATSLDTNSDFEIYSSDTSASIRWTIFGMSVNSSDKTLIDVKEWSVEVQKIVFPSGIQNSIENVTDYIENWEVSTVLQTLEITWVTIDEWGQNVITSWNSANTTDITPWVPITEPNLESFNTNFQTDISNIYINDTEQIIDFQNIPNSVNANVLKKWEKYYYTKINDVNTYSLTWGTIFNELTFSSDIQEINNWFYSQSLGFNSIEDNFKDSIIGTNSNVNIYSYMCYLQGWSLSCSWKKTIQLVDWKANYTAPIDEPSVIDQVIEDDAVAIEDIVIEEQPAECIAGWEVSGYTLKHDTIGGIGTWEKIGESLYSYPNTSGIANWYKVYTSTLTCNKDWSVTLVDWSEQWPINVCDTWTHSEFKMWTDVYCEPTSDWTVDWKKLYAFAPYDSFFANYPDDDEETFYWLYKADWGYLWSIFHGGNLLSSWGAAIPKFNNTNLQFDDDSSVSTPSGFLWNNDAHIMKYNDTKWIFIDNLSSDTFLKYQWLDFSSDFIIEISVRWKAFFRDELHALFHIKDYLKIEGKIWSGWDAIINFARPGNFVNFVLPSSYNEDSFIKIKIGTGKMFINDIEILNPTVLLWTLDVLQTDKNTLIIWAKYEGDSYTEQWNDVIDYVKIYK